MKLASNLIRAAKSVVLIAGICAASHTVHAAPRDPWDPKWHWRNQLTDKSQWPYDYKRTCYFNNLRRRCTIFSHSGRYTVTRNNHIDILWEDEEVTSIRYLEPPQKGAKVLINNTIPGVIQSSSYMNNVLSLRIKSSSGNTIRFRTSD